MNSEKKKEFQIPKSWLYGDPAASNAKRKTSGELVDSTKQVVARAHRIIHSQILLCDDYNDSIALAVCMLTAAKKIMLNCVGEEEFIKIVSKYYLEEFDHHGD